MILINLLPHREEAKKRRRETFKAFSVLFFLAGAAIVALTYLWFEARIGLQNARNSTLTAGVRDLDAKIKDVNTLEAEIALLKARQSSVEVLQANRNLPVHLFNELTVQIPDGGYLRSLKQKGNNIQVTGTAQSQEKVSEIMRNFDGKNPWVVNPKLGEVLAASIDIKRRDRRRVYNFSMGVDLYNAEKNTGKTTQ